MRHLSVLLLIVLLLGLPFLLSERPVTSSPRPLTGHVHDDRGPVVGAVVRVQGTSTFTFTDRAGRFRLPRSAQLRHLTAAQAGYFIGGISTNVDPLIFSLERLPQGDCERYVWVDPTPNGESVVNCGNCHHEIHDEWKGSGHAHSATNRRFVNLYDGSDWQGRKKIGWNLLHDHPDGVSVCASCHGPTLPTAEFDIRTATKSVPAGLSGVHCDFCHKIAGPGPGEFGLTHGRYQLELRRPDLAQVDQLFFGPLDDVDRGDDAFSPFQRDSRLCAACHEGVVFGVPVYTTYSEWLDSPAPAKGQSCQSCHMAPTGKMTNIARGHGGIERNPKTLGNHRFFAGSQHEMLKRCLKLEVRTQRTIQGLAVEVRLTAEGVGHRVPTGFIDRHLILQVEADRPLLQGPTLPALVEKNLIGQPGRIYAKTLKDEKGRAPVPFWRADPATLEDSRLEPGKTDVTEWLFSSETKRVRVHLTHRRFWHETGESKGWPKIELLVAEQTVFIP